MPAEPDSHINRRIRTYLGFQIKKNINAIDAINAETADGGTVTVVTTDDIENGAVTKDKIAVGSRCCCSNSAKISNFSIIAEDIAADAVTSDKLD